MPTTFISFSFLYVSAVSQSAYRQTKLKIMFIVHCLKKRKTSLARAFIWSDSIRGECWENTREASVILSVVSHFLKMSQLFCVLL